ncbi:MAG: HlyD family efflux transporter periplasmic adaptor subunit [Cyanobacteria bacterium P01_H01_bin.105]
MKHGDSFPSSMFDLPDQAKKSTAIEPSTDMDLIVELSKPSIGILAPIQDYQSRQAAVEEAQSLASPAINNCLPTPNRFLIFGGLGLLGSLGIGAIASTLLTYTTTVKTEAVIEPVGDVQSVQSGNGGVVDTIYVQDYDSVTSGQVIASFENPSIQKRVAQIEAQIAGTEEHIVQIDGQLSALERRRLAEVVWLEQLAAGGVGVGNNLPKYEHSKKVLLEHRGRLEAQLEAELGQLAQAQQEVENLIIRAHKAGTIYNLELKRLGQTFSADETIATIIPDGAGLEIRASLPDTQIETIEVGHPTKLALSECPVFSFGSLSGQVSSVSPAYRPTETNLANLGSVPNNTHVVAATANQQAMQSGSRLCELLPGMTGELTIITKQEKFLDFFLRKLRLKTDI